MLQKNSLKYLNIKDLNLGFIQISGSGSGRIRQPPAACVEIRQMAGGYRIGGRQPQPGRRETGGRGQTHRWI